MTPSLRRFRSILLVAAALAVALPSIGPDGSFGGAAAAKDGGDDGGGGGGHGGGDDDRGDDNGGHGGDRDDRGDRGDDDRKDDRRGDRPRRDDDRGRRGGDDVRVVVRGDLVQVTYPDGWRETVRRGWIELRDPKGRVVATRRLRDDDRRRIDRYAR